MYRRNFNVACFVLAALVAIGRHNPAWADFNGQLHSSEFDYKYEMDVEPWNQDLDGNLTDDWSEKTSQSVSDGILTLDSNFGPSGMSAYASGDDPNGEIWPAQFRDNYPNPRGYTTEVRAKVIDMFGTTGAISELHALPGGNNGTILTIGDSFTARSGEILNTESNTDGFHTFRVVRDTGLFKTFFYRDDVLIGNPLGYVSNYPGNISDFDVSMNNTTYAGVAEIDYVRITPGAWEPDPTIPEPSQDRTWNVDASRDWNGGSNWTGGPGPNANDENAFFGPVITTARTVVTDSAVTVKGITFGDTDGGTVQQSYAIAGHGSVNLESDTGTSTVSVLEGSHQFQAVVNLNNATGADILAAASLTFNNALNLNGNTLTKMGGGTLTVNNLIMAGVGGAIDCTDGTCSGNGTINGNLHNSGGTISPGNSPGVMVVDGDFSQAADGTLLMEIGGTDSGENHDLFQVTGTAQLAGILEVALLDGFQPAAGDEFDILDIGSLIGAFDVLRLPELTNGLAWEASSLYDDGQLAVVPEPASASLLIVAWGALALVGRRRRGKE